MPLRSCGMTLSQETVESMAEGQAACVAVLAPPNRRAQPDKMG